MKRYKALFFTVCLFSSLAGKSQTASLQEMLSSKQYEAVLSYAGQLSAADSADTPVMHAIAQAYEGVLRHREAFGTYKHCLTMIR